MLRVVANGITQNHLGKPTPDVTDPPVRYGLVLFRAFEPLDVFGPIQALFMLSRIRHLELALISETLDVVTTEPVVAAMNPMNSTVVRVSFFNHIRLSTEKLIWGLLSFLRSHPPIPSRPPPRISMCLSFLAALAHAPP